MLNSIYYTHFTDITLNLCPSNGQNATPSGKKVTCPTFQDYAAKFIIQI